VSELVTQSKLNALYRLQSSTDLHQTCYHGSVPGDVIKYCFSGYPEYLSLPNRRWN